MGIYVVTHKSITQVFPKKYKSIVVNANKNKIVGDFYDNVGDNISNKNFSYCELTAIYWLWKNCNDELIGIDHYRRFFCDSNYELVLLDNIEKILKKYNVILPKKVHFNRRMDIRFWTTSGCKNDLKIMEAAIEKLFPNYIPDYKKFMRTHDMYCYNMLITNKLLFNSYCEWLFPILAEIEKSISANDRHGYYQRVFGFIAERLLNVYIMHNNFSVYEMDVFFTGEKETIIQRIKTRLNKLYDKYRS